MSNDRSAFSRRIGSKIEAGRAELLPAAVTEPWTLHIATFFCVGPVIAGVLFGQSGKVLGALLAIAALQLAARLIRRGRLAERDYDERAITKAPLPFKTTGHVARRPCRLLPGDARAAASRCCSASSPGASWASRSILAYGMDPRRDKGLDAAMAERAGLKVEAVLEALEEARGKVSAIETSARGLHSRELKERLTRITASARGVLQQIEKDPRDLRRARRFLVTYLDGTRDVVAGYRAQQNDLAETPLAENFRHVLETVEQVFAEQARDPEAQRDAGSRGADRRLEDPARTRRCPLSAPSRVPCLEQIDMSTTPEPKPAAAPAGHGRNRPPRLPDQIAALSNELVHDLELNLEGTDVEKVEKAMAELDVTDSNSIIFFGSKAQAQLTEVSDSMLESVRTKDIGPAGDALNTMVEQAARAEVRGHRPARQARLLRPPVRCEEQADGVSRPVRDGARPDRRDHDRPRAAQDDVAHRHHQARQALRRQSRLFPLARGLYRRRPGQAEGARRGGHPGPGQGGRGLRPTSSRRRSCATCGPAATISSGASTTCC